VGRYLVEQKVARTALEKAVQYKKGHTIKKYGARQRTTVNAFLKLIEGEATPITLKTLEAVARAQ
jgi:hypothetical protein